MFTYDPYYDNNHIILSIIMNKHTPYAILLFLSLAFKVLALPRLVIRGDEFVEAASGNVVVLKGVSLTNQWWGRWVSPQSDSLDARGLNPLFRHTRTVGWFIDSIDYKNLQTLGGNVVRYEFSNELFEPANSARDSNLADMRQVIRQLEKQGKYTILCMCGSPGIDVQKNNYEDLIPGPRRMKSIFESDSLEKEWASVWTWLAAKLVADSAVAAFELLNEPRLPATADILPAQCADKYVRLCESIRSIDPMRLILIPEFASREANPGETYYVSEKPVVDTGEQGVFGYNMSWPPLPDTLKNIALVFHWYEPPSFVNDAVGDFSPHVMASGIQEKLSWPKRPATDPSSSRNTVRATP